MKKIKKFLSKFGFLLAIIAIVGFLAVIHMTVPTYMISTGSMEPTLPVGTIVLETSADSLEIGDIITFQQEGDGNPITHTLVGYEDDGSLMTMGDANPTPDVHDTPLTMVDVKGKVFTQFMIFVPGFWLSTKGLGVILLVGAAIFFYVTRDKSDKTAKDSKDEADSELHPGNTHEETRELNPA